MRVIKQKTYIISLLGRLSMTNKRMYDGRKKLGLKAAKRCFACGKNLSADAPVILATGKGCGNVQICEACEKLLNNENNTK